jgi:hypothetical protein
VFRNDNLYAIIGYMTEPEPPDSSDSHSPRAVLIALGFVLLLVFGGLYLVHTLRDSSNLQDCVMQGRSNCSPIDSAPAGN